MGVLRPKGRIERVSAWERRVACGWCGRKDGIIGANDLPVTAKGARLAVRKAGYRGSERHGWLCGGCHQAKPWGWEEQTRIYVTCSGCSTSVEAALDAGSARPALISLGWAYVKDATYPDGRWLCAACAKERGAVDSLGGALLPASALAALVSTAQHVIEPRAGGILIRQLLALGNNGSVSARRERVLSPATWAAISDAAGNNRALDEVVDRLLANAPWQTDHAPRRTVRKSVLTIENGGIVADDAEFPFYVPGGSISVPVEDWGIDGDDVFEESS